MIMVINSPWNSSLCYNMPQLWKLIGTVFPQSSAAWSTQYAIAQTIV